MSPHEHAHSESSPRRLALAAGVNLLLTAAQIAGGLASGSLALIADALHNFADAGGLLLALFAQRIAGRPADERRTFGYARAKVVGALINLTSIILVAVYLVLEAIGRLFERPEVAGWTVVIVASVALVVDIATALLTRAGSRHNINLRAAFLHNVADALASVAVVISGTLVVLLDWNWTDLAATVGISVYITAISWGPLKRCVRILMQTTPEEARVEEVARAIRDIDGVHDVAHLHIWPLDEHRVSLEVRVGAGDVSLGAADQMRERIERRLGEDFGIEHTTIEIRSRLESPELIAPHESPRGPREQGGRGAG